MLRSFVFIATLSSNIAWADIRCSTEFAPNFFGEYTVNEKTGKIYLTAAHLSAEAPYAKTSNPAETIWYAQFAKGRSVSIVQRVDSETGSICIEGSDCRPCRGN